MYIYIRICIFTAFARQHSAEKGAKRDEKMKSKPEIDRQSSRQRQHRLLPCSFPLLCPSLWYLWQPSCAAQTILCRLFVCFAHLNCCSFNIHSHAEGSSSVSGCGAPRPRVDIQIFSIDRFHNFPLSYLFLFLFFFWLLAMAQNWSAFLLLIVHSLSRSFAAFATLLLYLLLLLYIAHIFLLRLSGNWCVKLWLGLSSVPQQIVV